MSLRRIGSLVLATAALVPGCKEVSQHAPQSEIVIAVFASPNIPTPNDLALQAAPTLPSGAQKDLLQSFVTAGGFPADQAPTLSVPIRSYTFNTATNRYDLSATLPTVDPATLTAETAALYKVDVTPPLRVQVQAAPTQTAGAIALIPAADQNGSRRLASGRYVFAVRGGNSGAKTTSGVPISADLPIALTIPNKDLTIPSNQPPGGLTTAQLAQLVPIQQILWSPLTWSNAGGLWHAVPDSSITPAYAAIDGAFPHTDVASIAAFQIAPAAGPVALVDAVSGQAPLPIDLLRTGPNGTIANNAAFGPAAAGLATLDGFSTTAMLLAPTSVPVDAGTVNGGNVFLFKLGGAAPVLVPELKAVLGSGGDGHTAAYVAQPTATIIPQGKNIVTGLPCPAAGGCSPAIGLQPAVPAAAPGGPYYLPPLAENTSYAVVITTRVKDIQGRALTRTSVMQLLLETNPLAASGHSTLPGAVDDTTATALEAMRTQLQPVIAAVPGGADTVALAYTFKTQSFKTTSLALSAAPYSIEHGASTAIFSPTAAATITAPAGVPTTGIAGFYDVTFKSIDAIDKSTGALRATLATDLATPATVQALLTDLHALVAVPEASAVPFCTGSSGPRCAKLVVFGHGLNGSKEQLFAVASSLAGAGFVAAAIDFPLHGTRNWCSTSADCVQPGTTTQGTCTPFPGSAGQGDAAPPGQCTGGSVPATAASRYFIGANFFRTRDAFRQNILDVGALTLAVARPPAPLSPQPAQNPLQTALAATGIVVDPSAVYYEGLSLGSISGTSAAAANSRISRASLSVGGGTLVDVFTNSPAFQTSVEALFTSLLAPELNGQPFTFGLIDPSQDTFNLAVAQSYLQTLNVAKWILDPGEPVNYAVNLRTAPLPNLLADPNGSVPQSAKDVYGQIAQGDTVVPNPFNLLLYSLADANQTFYTGAGASHGMLATQAQVQVDAVGFLLAPSSPPPTTRSLP